MLRFWCSAALAVLIGLALAACTSSTGPGGGCEVIFITSTSDPAATTGLQIVNGLSGGLSVDVEGRRVASTGADMSAGECVQWGLFADRYDVYFQRCAQENAGSSKCTAPVGARVQRSVDIVRDEVTRVRVDPSFFN